MSPAPLRTIWGICLLWLAGCASPLPRSIQQEPPQAPAFSAVKGDPQAYSGAAVRWGGIIIRLDNNPSGSEMEVLAHPLDSHGRPLLESPAQGRFIARSPEFLDPAVYKTDSEVTLGGTVAEPVTRNIGAYPYTYPVVTITALHVWAPRPVYIEPPPYWFDPWYPWGYPYPRWHHHHHSEP